MKFFFRWVGREIQNDWAWIFLFVMSLSLGLFGFIGLESFRTALETNLRSNARNFLSADLSVSSRRVISAIEIEKIRSRVNAEAESHLTEFFSMAASKTDSRLVQVRAIDQNYPLYGEMRLGSGKVIRFKQSGLLSEKPIVWVYPELLAQLKISVGEKIRIGQLEFEVAETVADDSTQTFRLGGLAPKIYFSRSFLSQTGLLGFGATTSDVYLFRAPLVDEQLSSLARGLEKEIDDPNLQFQTPLDSAENGAQGVQTLLDYLGLVALVGLALALIGIGYLIQLFLSRRTVTLSLLRVLGLEPVRAEIFLLLELALLGAFAVFLTLPLSTLLLPVIAQLVSEFSPVPLAMQVTPFSIFASLGLALLLPVLIAWPLLRPFRRLNLKAVLMERELWQGGAHSLDRLTWLPAGVVFYLISAWAAHSWKNSFLFVAALLLSAIVTVGFSTAVLSLLPRFQDLWPWRYVRLRLMRAPLRFSVVIVALTFGTLLLVLLPQIRSSIKAELDSPDSGLLPSLFLFDVQDEQVRGLQQFLEQKNLKAQNLSPLVRGRLLAVNGIPFERRQKKNFESREEETEARFRNRGLNLTIRNGLSSSEEIVAGRPFSATPGPVAEISVERRYAERLGFELGDVLRFDIQGVEIEAKIANFRKVRWNSFQPNFFITFQPGFIEEAPKSWLLSVRSLPEPRKVQLQNEMVSQFPNVSMVDVSRVMTKVLELTDQMAMALTTMALLSVVVGLFVLFTVLIGESRNRIVEWNLYKVLGAEQKSVLRLFLREGSVISLLAATTGGFLGLLLSFAIIHWFFRISFTFSWPLFVGALLVPFTLTFLLSWRLGQRLLRSEGTSILAEGRL